MAVSFHRRAQQNPAVFNSFFLGIGLVDYDGVVQYVANLRDYTLLLICSAIKAVFQRSPA